MPYRPARRLVPFEQQVVATATAFYATVSLGRGRYEKRQAKSLEEVLRLAPALCAEHNLSAVIYASAPNGGTAIVGTWEHRP